MLPFVFHTKRTANPLTFSAIWFGPGLRSHTVRTGTMKNMGLHQNIDLLSSFVRCLALDQSDFYTLGL